MLTLGFTPVAGLASSRTQSALTCHAGLGRHVPLSSFWDSLGERQSLLTHRAPVQCVPPVGKRLSGVNSYRRVQKHVSFYG